MLIGVGRCVQLKTCYGLEREIGYARMTMGLVFEAYIDSFDASYIAKKPLDITCFPLREVEYRQRGHQFATPPVTSSRLTLD